MVTVFIGRSGSSWQVFAEHIRGEDEVLISNITRHRTRSEASAVAKRLAWTLGDGAIVVDLTKEANFENS